MKKIKTVKMWSALLFVAGLISFGEVKVNAATLDVYVNSSTWVISSAIGGSAWYWEKDVQACGATNMYGSPICRYYTFGSFTAVNIYYTGGNTVVQALTNCNNIFYIDRSAQQAYTLSTGFNGTGNGANNEIYAGKAFANGDFYIGGDFTIAGGYNHTGYFSCYTWGSGWSGVNEVEVNGTVGGLDFVGYDLQLSGSFSQVKGPAYSGGPIVTQNISGTAYWDNWNRDFADSFFK